MSEFVNRHLSEVALIAERLDRNAIESMVRILSDARAAGGRLFLLGVGGSAANCSHAVNDFRKLTNIEAYAPTDNVAELTARINDEGWDSCFSAWLKASRLRPDDVLLIMSVGGGDVERNVSPNLVVAIDYAKDVGARILGIVGRSGGYTGQMADACVIVPVVNDDAITPHTEAFQAVVWHTLVSHPDLVAASTKWEGMDQSPT
jgi:D-sedoheptulose 7-phosphate isomerase